MSAGASSPLRVLVTGANRGIGLGLVRAYVARGADVTAVVRKPSAELSEVGPARVIEGIDVTEAASVVRLTEQAPAELDIIINNAGILEGDSLATLDFASVSHQIGACM